VYYQAFHSKTKKTLKIFDFEEMDRKEKQAPKSPIKEKGRTKEIKSLKPS